MNMAFYWSKIMPVTINGDYIPPVNEGNNRYNSNARNLLAEI